MEFYLVKKRTRTFMRCFIRVSAFTRREDGKHTDVCIGVCVCVETPQGWETAEMFVSTQGFVCFEGHYVILGVFLLFSGDASSQQTYRKHPSEHLNPVNDLLLLLLLLNTLLNGSSGTLMGLTCCSHTLFLHLLMETEDTHMTIDSMLSL